MGVFNFLLIVRHFKMEYSTTKHCIALFVIALMCVSYVKLLSRWMPKYVTQVKVKFILCRSVNQPVCLGTEPHQGLMTQFSLDLGSYIFVSVRRLPEERRDLSIVTVTHSDNILFHRSLCNPSVPCQMCVDTWLFIHKFCNFIYIYI
jgi:hypothetical protein